VRDDPLLTQEDAALQLRVSVKTIQRLRATGALRCIPGRPILIRQSVLDDWLRRRETEPWKPKVKPASSATGQGIGKSAGPSETKTDVPAHALIRAAQQIAVLRRTRIGRSLQRQGQSAG
jgi:hypothetical protein